MKIIFVFFIAVLVCLPLRAGGVKPPPAVLLSKFIKNLEAAQEKGLVTDISTWSDIEVLPVEMQGALLGSFSEQAENISDYFVIIPRGQRLEVTDGAIYIVSAKPFNLTKWHRAHHSDAPENASERNARLAEYDALHPKDELVRWYVIKAKNGNFNIASMSEAEFQKLSKLNQFNPPEITKYRFNLSRHIEKSNKEEIGPPPLDSASQIKADTTIVSDKTVSIPVSKDKPAGPAWWIFGLIIVTLTGVALFLRKKR